jgi:3-deoxy-D-arabino-heptulosonate 7-phosphate (DAHP) synthase
MSDGQQSLKPHRFRAMMDAIRPLLTLMNKTL